MLDEQYLHIIESQQEQIKDLQDQNAVLTELLLKSSGVIDKEIIVGESEAQAIGRIPWNIRRQKLEILHKKEKNAS